MSVDYRPPRKRSVEIAGHKTSVSLEPLFWDMLQTAARDLELPLNALVARIDVERLEAPEVTGLAGAIRLWVTTRLVESGGHDQPEPTTKAPDTPERAGDPAMIHGDQ